MDDKQLLEAMQGMIQENNKAIAQQTQDMIQENNKALAQMMDEKIDSLRQDMNAKFDVIEANFDAVNEQLADIKEDTEITRSATNSLIDWAEQIGAVTQVKFPYNKAK